MADRISLDNDALNAALLILRREQSAYLPTRRELFLYRAFNVSAFSIVVAGFLLLARASMATDAFSAFFDAKTVSLLNTMGIAIAVFSGAGMLVLYPLNFGFMRKLYRHAKMRRRLKLANYFAPAFSANRKLKRLTNLLTMAMFVLGILVFSFGILMIGLAIINAVESDYFSGNLFGFVMVMAFALALMIIGTSFASIHFVRSGRQRLEIVQNLEKSLEKQFSAVNDNAGAGATVSASEYDAIAGIERQQIIRDRVTSIAAARKETSTEYMCQTSRQMYQTKSSLPPETLRRVEMTIADLLKDPSAGGRAKTGEAGRQVLRVADTPLCIHYGVDSVRHLVQLYELASPN